MFSTVRVAATYKLYGDDPGEFWFHRLFDLHQELGNVQAHQYLGTLTGGFGLQYVLFAVDLVIVTKDKDDAALMDAAREVLNHLINDRDVLVHGVERLEPLSS